MVTYIFVLTILAFALGDDSVVQTKYGSVRGNIYATYRKFEGIPYATPPLNELRFSSPIPPKPWNQVLNTQAWGPGCPQNCVLPPHTCPREISEDCLYLNVYTPIPVQKGLPVMVWIHGGHFDQGAAGCVLYDGGNFVTEGQVVMVSFNYRLGALGWLVTDEIPGNFGFEDQQLALKWVQENIAAFGGDPSKVTLFGQSAGGTSIRAHLIAPSSRPLFSKAILQSDPVSLPMQSTRESRDLGAFFLDTIGCNNVTCMRQMPIGKILEVQVEAEKHVSLGHVITLFLPFTPTVDGHLIPYHVFDAIPAGTWNNVPLMIGTMIQDAYLFIYQAIKSSMDSVEYEAAIAAVFLSEFATVTRNYPPSIFGDNRNRFSELGTDYIFTCPTRRLLELVSSKYPSTPLYLYQWNHTISWDAWGPVWYYCRGQVCHGSELPFEFNPPELSKYANFTSAEKVLSKQMINYWTNFAKNSNPTKGNPVDVIWPAWSFSSLRNLEFTTPAKVVTNLMKEKCDFWDGLGYHYGW